MIRLFTGLSMPDDVADSLTRLRGGIPGARWSPEENLHLTLRFIGEVDEDIAEQIDEALAGISFAPFKITLSGVGVFTHGSKPHALWAGVEPCEALDQLKEKIDHVLAKAGLLEADRRKYSPHVTLARLKNPPANKVGEYLEANNLFKAGPFTVSDFGLFTSTSTHNGPVYDRVRDYAAEEVLSPAAASETQNNRPRNPAPAGKR